MSIIVEILQGPLKGQKFELQPNMKIGRSGCDLNLKDPKVSSSHAEIRLKTGSLNSYYIFDLGSTNGIKVNGQRVNSLELLPGSEFQLGHTVLRIKSVALEKSKASDNQHLAEWRNHLVRVVSSVSPFFKSPAPIIPFDPPIELLFIEGPQKNQRFQLGYGPRFFGHDSSEFKIEDPQAHLTSFEVKPTVDGEIKFKSASREILINGKPALTASLKIGDKISFGRSTILISETELS